MTDLLAPMHITPNAGKSSGELNTAIAALFLNQQEINQDTQTVADQVAALERRLSLRLGCLTAAIPALSQPLVGDADSWYLDFHDLGDASVWKNTSQARHWPTYGIAVPAASGGLPDNQFTVIDDLGQVMLPSATRLYIAYTDSAGATPQYGEPVAPADALAAFDGQLHSALRVDMTAHEYVWIKAMLPLETLFSATLNAFTITPQPEFGAVLHGAYYSTDGSIWSDNLIDDARPAVPEFFTIPDQRVVAIQFLYQLPSSVTEERALYLVQLGAHKLTYQNATVVLDCRALLPSNKQFASPNSNNAAVNPLEERASERVGLPTPQLIEITPGRKDGVQLTLTTRSDGRPICLSQLFLTLANY